MRKICDSNKGITLLTLTITIVIMLILSFTVSANVSTYVERKQKTNLETDIAKLQEEINHYYNQNKTLPIANKYTNTEMLQKNANDNDNYYVIDLSKIENLDLNYGKDYEKITDFSVEINNLLDIYIINEQSHTIYYPKGIQYSGKTYHTTDTKGGTKIEDMSLTGIEITGENVAQIGDTVQLTAKILPTFIQNTGVTWTTSDETIATVDENGIVTTKKVGAVTITATSKDNNELTSTHTINIELNAARYILLDVYDHLGYNAASISELEIYDENASKIQYSVITAEAYDSVTESVPTYWENENYWNYTNLYDRETSYTSNTEGEQNCTLFMYESTPESSSYARFIVDLGEEKSITDIKAYVGDADSSSSDGEGGRTPVSISAYKITNYFAHEKNNTFSTYYNNVAQRNNNGLKLLGTLEFTEKVTTTTEYSLMK